MDKVAVLIPFYNRREFIIESVKSALQPNCEIFLYDDGSTDGGIDLSGIDYMDQKLIHLIKSGSINAGVASARNELLKISLDLGFEYFAWQDSDDVSHPDRIGLQLEILKNRMADVCFSDMYFFNHPQPYKNTHTIHKIDISKYINREGLYNNTNFATAVFNKKVANYQFKEHLRSKEDTDWLTRLIADNIKFCHIPMALYYCRRHGGRLTYENRGSN